MNKLFVIGLILLIFSGFSMVQAQNGFLIWTKGGDCERDLKFNKIVNGELGPEEEVVTDQKIAPSWVNISYDGVWMAFCQVESTKGFNNKYGICDYHDFDIWDLYVVKIDNGKSLPAKSIKVDHGYFPSWGMDENAKDPDKPKLIYYSRFKDGTIRKAVINPDGTIASKDVKHATCPKIMGGTDAHTQGSPDGKFILYRPKTIKCYSIEAGKDICDFLGGCHPSWGPRSRYFIRSANGAYLNEGTSVKELGAAFPFKQDYWQAISNDSHYDEGKLWAVGRENTGSRAQTAGKPMHFVEVDISNDGWETGKVTDIGPKGVTGDIHIWKGDGPPVTTSVFPRNKLCNGVNFSARVSAGPVGLRLVIESMGLVGYSAGLYNLQGVQKAFIENSDNSQNIIPLRGIADGMYMIRLNTPEGSAQKAIRIVR